MAKSPLIKMDNCIFLSAGIPDQPSRGNYVATADPVAIRDSVRALTGVALSRGYNLVFGGHPAISPLVAQIAESRQKLENVIIYQSENFKAVIPEEAKRFWHFRWTPLRETQEKSLRKMREMMFSSSGHQFIAAVFIGGMDGVEKEYYLFKQTWPQVPLFLVGSTGGATFNLWSEFPNQQEPLQQKLGEDLLYQSLFEEALP